MIHDVVVVGGGVAGLSAGLVLGRASRRTLIVDADVGAPEHASHGLFSRDGTDARELLLIARSQLAVYDSVTCRTGVVTDAEVSASGIQLQLSDGTPIAARSVLLAFGVVYTLPPIEGISLFWGSSACHCPFCQGWEYRNRPIAVLGAGDEILDLSAMLSGWSDDVVVCSNGPIGLDQDQLETLTGRGTQVCEEPIARLEGTDRRLERIVFKTGRDLRRDAVFLQPGCRLGSPLGRRLGCAHTVAGLLHVDAHGATTVPGVYAAGDIVSPLQHAVFAAASGTAAGMAIARRLLPGPARRA